MVVARVGRWADLEPFPMPKTGPRINRVGDVRDFIARWQKPESVVKQVRSSEYGNLNNTGEPGKRSAPALTPSDQVQVDGRAPQDWTASLEEGARDLVPTMVTRYDCVTISSCGGHDYSQLTDLPNETRSVQILARTPAEADRLAQELTSDLARFRSDQFPAVDVAVTSRELESAADGSLWQSINVNLRPVDQSWEAYFEQLDDATREVLANIKDGAAEHAVPDDLARTMAAALNPESSTGARRTDPAGSSGHRPSLGKSGSSLSR